MSRTPCPVCGFPLATTHNYIDAPEDLRDDARGLCWSEWTDSHAGPAIDWRARALRAEAALPRFESDCDRECKAVTYKAGFSLPVHHSPFCKHGVSR